MLPDAGRTARDTAMQPSGSRPDEAAQLLALWERARQAEEAKGPGASFERCAGSEGLAAAVLGRKGDANPSPQSPAQDINADFRHPWRSAAPVGQRKQRRNSYSVGYGAGTGMPDMLVEGGPISPQQSRPVIPGFGTVGLFSDMKRSSELMPAQEQLGLSQDMLRTSQQSAGPRATRHRRASVAMDYGSSQQTLQPAIGAFNATAISAEPQRPSQRWQPPSLLNVVQHPVSSPQPATPAEPLLTRPRATFSPDSNGQADSAVPPSERSGLGWKFRRMLTRSISKAQLGAAPQPGSGNVVNGQPSNLAVSGALNTPVAQPAGVLLRRSTLSVGNDGVEKEVHAGNQPQQPQQHQEHGSQPGSGTYPGMTDVAASGVHPAAPFKRGLNRGVVSYIRPLATLPPFVPRLLKEDVACDHQKYAGFDELSAKELASASKALVPSITEFQGAVMIADVKGFTQLTEILSKKGTAGVELLTNCMNNYFTRVINMILAFDGDVVKFAGDSMIVAFSPTEQEAEQPDKGLYPATLRCTQCAHVLATRLGHMRMKMNGQVEPINVQAPERVPDIDEGTGESYFRLDSSSQSQQLASSRRTRTMTAASSPAQAAATANGALPSNSSSQSQALVTGPASMPWSASGGLPQLPSALTHSNGAMAIDSPRSSHMTGSTVRSSTISAGVSYNLPDAPDTAQVSTLLVMADAPHARDSGPLRPTAASSTALDAAGQGQPPASANRTWVAAVSTALSRKMGGYSQPARVRAEAAAAASSSGGASPVLGASPIPVASSLLADPDRGTGSGSQTPQPPAGGGAGPSLFGLGSALRRARAATDTQLSAGKDAGGSRASGIADTNTGLLWGLEAGGGFVRRELSLASKLNIPPPVRMLGGRASGIGGLPSTAGTLGAPVGDGAGVTANGWTLPDSDLGAVGGAARRASGSAALARPRQGLSGADRASGLVPALGGAAAGAGLGQPGVGSGAGGAAAQSWASKFQNLQSGVTAGLEDALLVERRRASHNLRASTAWEPLQEVVDEGLGEEEGEEGAGGSPGPEDAASSVARSAGSKPSHCGSQDRVEQRGKSQSWRAGQLVVDTQAGMTPGNGVQLSSGSRNRLADMRKRIFGGKRHHSSLLGSGGKAGEAVRREGGSGALPSALVAVLGSVGLGHNANSSPHNRQVSTSSMSTSISAALGPDDSSQYQSMSSLHPSSLSGQPATLLNTQPLYEWSEDSYPVEAGGGLAGGSAAGTVAAAPGASQRRLFTRGVAAPTTANIGGYMAPGTGLGRGPIAEGVLLLDSEDLSAAACNRGPPPVCELGAGSDSTCCSLALQRQHQHDDCRHSDTGHLSRKLVQAGPAQQGQPSRRHKRRQAGTSFGKSLPFAPELPLQPELPCSSPMSGRRRHKRWQGCLKSSTSGRPRLHPACLPATLVGDQHPGVGWQRAALRSLRSSSCDDAKTHGPGVSQTGASQMASAVQVCGPGPVAEGSPWHQPADPELLTAHGSNHDGSPTFNPHGGLEPAARVASHDYHGAATVGSSRNLLVKLSTWFQPGPGRKAVGKEAVGPAFDRTRRGLDVAAKPRDGTSGSGDEVSHPSQSAASMTVNPALAGHRMAHPPGTHPAYSQYKQNRDPIIEEVENSEFSLKIMISAGSVCVFHVGGDLDEVTDPTVPEVPRWEYFIGDRPLAPLRDELGRRRCIAQLALIEKHAEAGEVVGSREVIDLMQEDWEIEMLPDDVGRMHGPWRPFVMPAKGSPPAYGARPTDPGSLAPAAPQQPPRCTAPAASLLLAHEQGQSQFTRLSASATAHTLGTRAAAALLGGIAEQATLAEESIADADSIADQHATASALAAAAAAAAEAVGRQPLVPVARPGGPRGGMDFEDAEDAANARHEFAHLNETVQRRVAGLLRMHVLGSVRSRIEAGHLDFINEIRPLTCLFLGFPSLSDTRDQGSVQHADQVAAVQFTVQQVQQVMRKWDGSLLQYRCDEKGFVGICAFGLPGHTHEDNPSRGILAALELQQRIQEGQHRVCIGVTTGDLLCTCVGARKIRSEYTVFGDAINLSARLMCKCKAVMSSTGGILCDLPTHQHASAQRKAKYKEMEPFQAKGKKLPVVLFHVTPCTDASNGADPDGGQGWQEKDSMPGAATASERPLVGRDTEMTFVLNRAANMIAGMATGGTIILEGTTGMGKTKLLTEVRKSLHRINMDTNLEGKPSFCHFFGMADIANKSQKLHPWRRIFQEFFASDRQRGGTPFTPTLRHENSSLSCVHQPLPAPTTINEGDELDALAQDSAEPSAPSSSLPEPEDNSTAPDTVPTHPTVTPGQPPAPPALPEPVELCTALGNRLVAHLPSYNLEWRQHLSELLDLPLVLIPCGIDNQERGPDQLGAHLSPAPISPLSLAEGSFGLGSSAAAAGQAHGPGEADEPHTSRPSSELGKASPLSGIDGRSSSLRQGAASGSGPRMSLDLDTLNLAPVDQPSQASPPAASQRRPSSMSGTANQLTLVQRTLGSLTRASCGTRPPQPLQVRCSDHLNALASRWSVQSDEQGQQAATLLGHSSGPTPDAAPSTTTSRLARSTNCSPHQPSNHKHQPTPGPLAPRQPASQQGPLPSSHGQAQQPLCDSNSTLDASLPPHSASDNAEASPVSQVYVELQDRLSAAPHPAQGSQEAAGQSTSNVTSTTAASSSRPLASVRQLDGPAVTQAPATSQATKLPGHGTLASMLLNPSAMLASHLSNGSPTPTPTPPSSTSPFNLLHNISSLSRSTASAAAGASVLHPSPSKLDTLGAIAAGLGFKSSIASQPQSEAGGVGYRSFREQQCSTPLADRSSAGQLSQELSVREGRDTAGAPRTSLPAVPSTTGGVAAMRACEHGGLSVAAPLKKNSLNFLVSIVQEYTALYGPLLIALENLHDFDTWSWQLLIKVAEVLSSSVLIIATTRPNEPPATSASLHSLHGKAAMYHKVAMMYRHLLQLPTTSRVQLEAFTFQQTKALMQVVADINYPEQYVMAVRDKTGGMPLYIEKVTEFLCQKPWLEDEGGEFAANVNKMIRNLNFQQVIIERMDRLKPGIHLSLKVASVMGQWVDLDILHKFYPINKSREELRSHLIELERGNFLKPTDTEGVWECNMVERDIVYEVIPHYQRRRLHAKLAQELERSLEEAHVASLTTIAYHWNQACMGHEVTEVECALKAIEYWHQAAETAYAGSSLVEALRLYQKAAQIAELLGESLGDASFRGGALAAAHAANQQAARAANQGPGHDPDNPDTDQDMVDGAAGHTSFSAVGSAYKGQLHWNLISRITRAQWEKSMASCCLGIVMQHRLEYNQMEIWDTEDYFTLLTEHAIRGLMLLGAPHPRMVLASQTTPPWWAKLVPCLAPNTEDELAGWQAGVVLQDQEVTEIRDILLVLIIAAEHYSQQQDASEYTRLLTFCKRICNFFNKCSDTGLDSFMDIRSACSTRIRTYKAMRPPADGLDFGVAGPILGQRESASLGQEAAQQVVPGPELSRAVLGMRRFPGPLQGRGCS